MSHVYIELYCLHLGFIPTTHQSGIPLWPVAGEVGDSDCLSIR